MGDDDRRPVEGTAEFVAQEANGCAMQPGRIGGKKGSQLITALDPDQSKSSSRCSAIAIDSIGVP